jgi:two-component system sensor histidine kinase YesM
MNRFRNISISRSILAFITIIVFLVLSIWGLITYNIFLGTTNDVVESTSKEINKQIIMNYESYIFDVIEVADYITQVTLEFTLSNNEDELEKIYETMDNSNQFIASISLLTNLGASFISSDKNEVTYNDLNERNWFYSAYIDSSIYHFSTPHVEDIYPGGDHQVITVSKVIKYIDNDSEKSGVLVMELEVSNFDKLTEVTNLGEDGHIIITDENYNTVFTNDDTCFESDCKSIDLMKDIILGGTFAEVDDVSMYVNVNTIYLTRWRIATFVNAEQINTATDSVIISFLVAFSIAFAITVYISSLFSNRITSPIYKLNDYMKKFQKGNLNSKVEVKGQKELVELGDSFNEMIDEISSLMNEVLNEQMSKRKTQLIALQNQINPHFLYNTLDSILYLSENKRNEDVEQMIVALSKFFRTSISNEKNVIPLSEEIDHIQSYLLIQKIRYHNRFSYTFEIDESLLDFNVLKLGLQPIVENAIYHGINPETEDNIITIRAYRTDYFVCVEVQNNGYGISEKDIQKIYEGFKDQSTTKHIGLRNTNQRLQLYYGEKSRLEIKSELDEYTIVRVYFPITRGENL